MGPLLIITIWKREKLRTIAESITRSLYEEFCLWTPSLLVDQHPKGLERKINIYQYFPHEF